MQERYSEEVKSILEAAQQQAVMNYQQELSCAHILAVSYTHLTLPTIA